MSPPLLGRVPRRVARRVGERATAARAFCSKAGLQWRRSLHAYLCLMKKEMFGVLACLAACLPLSGLRGQAVDTQKLTLRQVLEQALVHSTYLRKARWDQQAALLRLKDQQQNSRLPKMQFTATAEYVPALPTTFLPATLFGGPEGAFTAATLGQPWQVFASVRVEQPLIDESARRMAPAATLSHELQDLLVRQTEEDVLFQVAQLFYQSLQATALLRSIDAHIRQLEALERTVRLQQRNDMALGADVQRVQVALMGLRAHRQELVGSIEALHQSLQFVCGIPFEQPIMPVDERPAVPPDTSVALFLPAVPVEQTTTYRLLAGQGSLLRLQERSARAKQLPTLGLYAQAGLLSQRPDALFTASNGRWYPLGSVGLRLEWPFLEGHRQRYRRDLLRLEGERNAQERDDWARARLLEQRQAQTQWENALRTLRAREQRVALARDWVKRINLSYQQEMVALAEVLAAQTALAEAETQYEQQVFTCRLAEVKWLKAAGRLHALLE